MNTNRLIGSCLRAMGRAKLRTVVMMVGSLLGVAALTFTVSLGNSARRKMVRTVQQIVGESSVLVMGGGSRMLGSPRGASARLTLDDAAAIAAQVPGIDVWDPQADLGGQTVRAGDATTTVRVLGSSERFGAAWARGVERGEPFDAGAVAAARPVALIGATVVRALFGAADPVGSEIRIGAVPFRIIGVLETFGTDMHGMDRDNEIVVPISTLMRRITNTDAISGARFSLAAGVDAEATSRAVRDALRTQHAIPNGRPDDFRLITSTEARQMLDQVTRAITLYVPLAAAVIL
ncbi:MAG: ABC transporter permease [Gemmatimonadales bacterium]